MVETQKQSEIIPANINSILAATGLRHTLQLYTPNVNRYSLQLPFLTATENDEIAVYITNESAKSVLDEFKELDIDITIINPSGIKNIHTPNGQKLRIVVDAGSLDTEDHLKMEKYLSETGQEHFILCTYDVSKLSPDMLKDLVSYHDKLMLTTNDVTLFSSESLEELNVSEESVQRFVKNELETIALALILKKPMCGMDIIKKIHKDFNVMLSPGTVYPLLHSLQKRGLLKCEFDVKTKIYSPKKGTESKIKEILKEQVQANNFLNKFLQSTELSANH